MRAYGSRAAPHPYGKSMNNLRLALDRFVSPAVGLIFTVLSLLSYLSSGAEGASLFLLVLSGILLGMTIAATSRFPRAALCIVVGFMLMQLRFPFGLSAASDWPVYLTPAVVVFFAATNPSSRVRLQALGATLVLVVVSTLLYGTRLQQAGRQFLFMTEAGSRSQGDIVLFWAYLALEFSILLVGGWLIGFAVRMTIERFTLMRERTQTTEAARQAELQLAVAGEKNRISRELHDVLAHSLAVIAAQADGTRYLNKDQPPMVTEALENISDAARAALIDAQRVIENVSISADLEAPEMMDVDALIDQMRQGHLSIDRTDMGAPQALTRDQELTVYRIAQESLTNALKHAGFGSTVTLRFNWDGPGMTLHITSTPDAAATSSTAPEVAGSGRGICGLRDRAESTGGWLTAEADGHSFVTTAFIPYLTANAATADHRSKNLDS